ncbi:universal stress protein [Nitriliruptor alkaliphilus]|uniref:universal stress protein n=1 Tax=Nitriliruptor alkaliphilus TaxID=427918 RepID=UPI000697585D|nr:universal stress protein [Nitriliruptor alkaliphilus]
MTYSHVLVGTDGSATAARAVAAAARAAAATGAPVVIVTAWQRHTADPPALSEESRYPGGSIAAMDAQWAIETTSDAAGVVRAHGVEDVRQVQAVGAPAEALLESAGTYPDALLVVGTAGLTERAERLIGNVPHQLTHHAPVDLLLCTGAHDQGWSRIALATDGSRTAARAVDRGLALARSVGAEATLLTVARSEGQGQKVLATAVDRGTGLEDLPQQVATDGDVVRGLGHAGADYDLLVIGNKGMSGPSRLLGSVSNRITHEVPTDLLLVNTTR